MLFRNPIATPLNVAVNTGIVAMLYPLTIRYKGFPSET